jgi:hypothetical protein
MIKRALFLTVFISLLGFSVAFSQSNESDPFKNDPFFSKPLNELLGKDKGKTDSTSTDVSTEEHHPEIKHYVSRISSEGVDFGGVLEAGPYNSSALYGAYPVLPMVHFNRVNGLFLGIKEERMQWYNHHNFLGIRNINPHGMLGYSFGQKEWQYELGLERYVGFKNRVLIGAEFYNATSTDDYWRSGLTETTLTSFFAGYDFLDYYKQKGWGAYALFRTKLFFEGGVSYNDDRFNSLSTASDFAVFGPNGRYRRNPPVEIINGTSVDTLNIASLSISGAFNPKKLLLTPHFTLSLSGKVELGDPGISSSDYSYTKYTAELTSYLNFEPGGVFKYRLKAGSITGDAPFMKEFRLGGPGTLRAMPINLIPTNALSGNKMLLSNAEIQLGSTGHSSGGWLDFDDFYISLFLDSGWANHHTGTNAKVLDGFQSFKISSLEHNGGFGLGTDSFRFELAWDLRHTSRAPVLWFRLNPTF